MNRRSAVLALLALGTLPRFAAAQTPPRIYRLGLVLSGEPVTTGNPFVDALVQGLAQQNYEIGRNLALEPRGAQNRVERYPELVDELVASRVDAIVTFGYPAARAAKQRSANIPVVVFGAGDPVASGLVESLARPGGNLTGTSDVAAELAPKRLQLLTEVKPQLRRVAMIWNAGDLGMTLRYESSAAAARLLGILVQPYGVREPEDFGNAFEAMVRDKPDAILMVADRLTNLNRKKVFEFAARHRLPSIYEGEASVIDGGLMSYGPDFSEVFARTASLVSRIFKGARPSDLPFEQPTRFRLVINMKTARSLGIKIPQELLLQADKVIE